MHYSKRILELQLREKNLVRLQEYEKAKGVQQEIEDAKIEEGRQKLSSDLEVLELRKASMKKQQQSSLSTLLQKIQKDRNDHMKQRVGDSEKIIVRNKSLIADVHHRHAEAGKKIF